MTSVARERVLLGGILAAAAFTRLYRLDLTWYFLDQVRDVSTAVAIASGERFPLVGPLIGWTHGRLGPLYFYLIAPPFLVSGSPMAGVLFVALAGVLAVFLLYQFARDLFGRPAALAAAALFAVFPLAVLSGRVLWNPALIPLFTVLLMRSLFAVVGGRSRAIVGVSACLAVLTQLHLSTACLVAVTLAALAIWRPRLEPAHLVAAGVVFAALYAPYLVHEATHGGENVRALLRGFAGGNSGVPGERAFLAVVANLLSLDRSVLDGFAATAVLPPPLLQAFSWLYRVEALLFGIGLLACVYRVAKGPAAVRRPAALVLLWIAIPVAMLGTRRTALWWYYFDLLYPSQFLVAGLAVSLPFAPGRAPAGARRLLAAAGVGLVVAIVAVQTWFQAELQRSIDRAAEIVLDVPRLSVAAAPSSIGQLSFLPYAHRVRLLEALLTLGLDASALGERVHGPVLGLPEENEYLLGHLAGRSARRAARGGSSHYLVLPERDADQLPPTSRTTRVGRFVASAYEPTIDYRGWSQAELSRRGEAVLGDGSWQRRGLPVASPGALGSGHVLAWQGGQRIAEPVSSPRIVVSLIAEAPVEVFRIDGAQLVPLVARSWQSPSLYATTVAEIDTGTPAASAEGPIAFAVAGYGRVMRVDVYERGGG